MQCYWGKNVHILATVVADFRILRLVHLISLSNELFPSAKTGGLRI